MLKGGDSVKVLLGLIYGEDTKRIEKSIRDTFIDELGDVDIVLKTSLFSVKEEIDDSYDALIIQEHIEQKQKVTAKDLDVISDKASSVNIVLVLDEENRESPIMKQLFNIGVYSAIFGEEANFSVLVDLAINGRSKAEAKTYYRLSKISSQEIELAVIDDRKLEEVFTILRKAEDPVATFEELIYNYSLKQRTYFVGKLPDDIANKLDSSEIYRNLRGEQQKQVQVSEPVVSKGRVKKNVANSPKVVLQKVEQRVEAADIPLDYKKTIAVVSLEPKLGSTTIACDIASEYSKRGLNTALIDTDVVKFEDYYRFNLGSRGNNLIGYLSGNRKKGKFGEKANKYLNVYTDCFLDNTKDVMSNYGEEMIKLLKLAKDEGTVVVLDIPFNKNRQDEIEGILNWVDHIILVVNQNSAVISRLDLYSHILRHKKIDFVINEYNKSVKQYQEKQLGYKLEQLGVVFNRSFTVVHSEEVREALAERNTVMLKGIDCEYADNIKNICDYYYITKKRKGFFRRKNR